MSETNPFRVFSYGGGVQSNAVLVLQATGQLAEPYDVFVFANVGADSENPDTLDYIDTVARPYAERHGINLVEVQKVRRDGSKDTLMRSIYADNRSVPIPAYMSGGAPGNRSCTQNFKIEVVDRWIKPQGYTHVVMGLGISLDEYQRMRDEAWHDANGTKKFGFLKKREYPLIDLRLRRHDCAAIITRAGLPLAPKSSCFFCPFLRRNEWLTLKREHPERFEAAVAIEQRINENGGTLGRDRVFLHSSLVPLDQAVGDQPLLFSDESMSNCETGYCMT